MQALFQRFVLIMVLAGLLAGCGFHLRNSDALVAHAPVRIDGLARYDSLHKRLEEALTASGVSLASSPETAKTVMKIRDLGENQQVITVDSRGKATEYMLIRKVRVSLVTPAGRMLVPEQEVGVRRTWIEVGKTGLAGYREARELREEMLQELSVSVLGVLDYALR